MEKSTTPLNDVMNLSNKTAIVTGGAKGIGLGILRRLHEAGARVVIADPDSDAADVEAQKLNALRAESAIAVTTDVSNEQAVKQLVEATVKAFGSIDILVNNAGIFPQKTIATMSLEDFQKVIDINLEGAFLCTKYACAQMISQGNGGKVINITSIDALHPSMIGLAHYDASKHGMWGFTKNAAREYAQHNIWINAIAPGGIVTPGVAALQNTANSKSVDIESFLAKIPMKRMGDPDEIGKVALFLASDLASYMTGAQIVVDGGALLS